VVEGNIGSELFMDDRTLGCGSTNRIDNDIKRIIVDFDEVDSVASGVLVDSDDCRNGLPNKNHLPNSKNRIPRNLQSGQSRGTGDESNPTLNISTGEDADYSGSAARRIDFDGADSRVCIRAAKKGDGELVRKFYIVNIVTESLN
jgi:hypothetical protein